MIISITHEHDLDGIGSQAILKRYFDLHFEEESPKFIQHFAHYLDFVEKVKNISKLDPIPTKLIITDIGFNEDFQDLFLLFEELKKKGANIFWFDHHIVNSEIKDKIMSSIFLYLNDPLKCAAEIVKDYYLPNDTVALKIAELARDSDFKTNKFLFAGELQLIIGYNRGEDKYKEKIKLVSLLSKGAFQDPWFRAQLDDLQTWFKEESAFALNHIEFVNIEYFGNLAISFARISGGKITDIIKANYPNMKVYIGIDTRFNEIIISSDYINCRDFALEFGGGGHKPRAGFKYSKIFSGKQAINPQFIQDIKRKLRKIQNN
ncbi:MAG: DHH family phosphoesterase [Promethearchaeota archaeon]